MTWSREPLAYCTNVHAGSTWDEARRHLEHFAADVRRQAGSRIGIGLWLSNSALNEALSQPAHLEHWQSWLAENDIVVATMNAFPFGDFHARRVKENVYRPDWTTIDRLEYTCRAADLLACLLPEGGEGSLSSLPLAFAPHHPVEYDTSIYVPRLIEAAAYLHTLADRTGRTIRLAIEPEPGCVLETTAQAIGFFESLWRRVSSASDGAYVREHLGLCYDVCHQAVEYEDVAASIAGLERAGVRIAKAQLSCALELTNPADEEARRELSMFAEERYLHQTYALHPSGRILKRLDLTTEHAMSPNAEWLDCRSWRIHFHVPVDRESMGRLATTRPQLEAALQALRALPYAPQLEVETYTWDVLPINSGPPPNLAEGIAAELSFVKRFLSRPDTSFARGAADLRSQSQVQNPALAEEDAE